MNDYDHPLTLKEKKIILFIMCIMFYIIWIFKSFDLNKNCISM
jgi:hypothetical protein